jgi:Na+-translocating ferredoxin:NAD+ oxidoreductase RnfA subunit
MNILRTGEQKMINLFLYYLFSSSIVLYYGTGINRIITLKKNKTAFIMSILKALLITVSSSVISYLINIFVLIPLGILSIFPFITALFFISISFCLHSLLKTGSFDLGEDYVLPFMVVLMSLNEGFSLVSVILINFSGVLSFYLLLLLVFALRRRFSLYQNEKGFKPYFVMLISISVIFIALYCTNVSWLTLDLY